MAGLPPRDLKVIAWVAWLAMAVLFPLLYVGQVWMAAQTRGGWRWFFLIMAFLWARECYGLVFIVPPPWRIKWEGEQ